MLINQILTNKYLIQRLQTCKNIRYIIVCTTDSPSDEKLVQFLKQENINSSFIYLELKKHNQFFIEKIESARDTKAILEIWEEMKIKSFLNYNVDLQKQEQHLIEFKELNLKEQKQCLCELLDKNQLYVNFSSLNDKDFCCSEEEKKVTNDFYNRNNI